MNKNFLRGMSHGIPICLGYLSVSFGLGILSVNKAGLSIFQSALISATCLTSAGQKAGIDVIAASGAIIEMILLQLTINIRYSLMAISLSQKLDKCFTTPHRLLASYGITDEIFAVCSAQKEPLTPAYMYGMILIAGGGWVLGTAPPCRCKRSYGDSPVRYVHCYSDTTCKKTAQRSLRRCSGSCHKCDIPLCSAYGERRIRHNHRRCCSLRSRRGCLPH